MGQTDVLPKRPKHIEMLSFYQFSSSSPSSKKGQKNTFVAYRKWIRIGDRVIQ